ncbi:unnamed protein product [Urochloa decumbens]|uniref:Dirigent protein n=1 Tax=Urochloa decumbens TaxID=240449 RepID=A0ABC9GAW3_9POAL
MANPCNLQVTPCVTLTECNELNFQGLFMYPTANQARVMDSQGMIGETTVNNWPVYDGPGPHAKLVARAQGLHIQAGNRVNFFSLVFQNERFNGSTLQVMGITLETGEWAIVGGTGQFAMATGVISKRFHEQRRDDGDIIELTIRAFCPLLKGTRYPVTKIGTLGGSGGSLEDIPQASKRLESIMVFSSSRVVNSFAFSYVDYAGRKHSAGPWGSAGGDPHPIPLAGSEVVTQVSGTIGSFSGYTVITSIKFVTSRDTYGPWGKENGTPFTVPVQPGSGIVGFFARAGMYLDAIGVYVRPL